MAGSGRLRGFRQPPWGGALRSWGRIGPFRAGSQPAQSPVSLRPHDLPPHGSSRPKPLHRPPAAATPSGDPAHSMKPSHTGVESLLITIHPTQTLPQIIDWRPTE